MNCEIEFLPVGSASKAGDAILVRYGTPEDYELMIIDGGFADTGKELVEHVQKHFGDTPISHVLLTHPDQDHASGLRTVLEELDVRNFWVNFPWDAVDETVLGYFANKKLTVDSLRKKLLAEYDLLGDLFALAYDNDIPIHSAFAGAEVGPFTVLSPTKAFYQLLLPQFDRTPDADKDALGEAWIPPQPGKLAALVEKVAEKVRKFFTETWTKERLKDGGRTSATNESSVVLYGYNNKGPVLLTGDAGNWALTEAADYADAHSLPLQQFSMVQIPHHGSRRNVGPTILNRLLGGIQPEGTDTRFSAMVSAPANDDTHPRQMVINAFLRRGGKVLATQGACKLHRGGFPQREGYSTAEGMDFVAKVEDYDD